MNASSMSLRKNLCIKRAIRFSQLFRRVSRAYRNIDLRWIAISVSKRCQTTFISRQLYRILQDTSAQWQWMIAVFQFLCWTLIQQLVVFWANIMVGSRSITTRKEVQRQRRFRTRTRCRRIVWSPSGWGWTSTRALRSKGINAVLSIWVLIKVTGLINQCSLWQIKRTRKLPLKSISLKP